MAKPPTGDAGKAYGQEGQFFICGTCGKSIPITKIEGECVCGNKVCRECGKKYPLCAKCGWVICKHCHSQSKKDKKHYHSACMPSECFIATAAYGTVMATELDTLREFRDNRLNRNVLGRHLVRFYYSISPPLANTIARSEGIRALVRLNLNPIIRALKSECDRKD